MNILIFEDEIPAYEKLLSFIDKHLPKANVKGWGRSIIEAKRLLAKNEDIELIFSDIELLDGSSFSVYDEQKVNCPIIFCTAFDQYILKAFQSNGIAYLLKPYNDERFAEAIEKYELLFSTNKEGINNETFQELNAIVSSKDYKKRFSIKKKGGIKLMNVVDISGFQANGDFSFAYDQAGQKHVINYSLGDIESKVDPDKFFRINRSEMVNIDFIEKIEAYFKNRLSIKLQGREDSIHTSTSRTPEFRNWIDR